VPVFESNIAALEIPEDSLASRVGFQIVGLRPIGSIAATAVRFWSKMTELLKIPVTIGKVLAVGLLSVLINALGLFKGWDSAIHPFCIVG
jgi:hypothetical protein